MRVVSGTAKGTALEAPKGLNTRPTADKVKEGVFSALQHRLSGARVLDVFAGSGGMGIEALSRGAEECTFVDIDANALRCIRSNLAKTGLNGTVAAKEAIKFLEKSGDVYDLIFSDPPYNKGLTKRLIPLAARLLPAGGLLVCETDEAEPRPQPEGGLRLYRDYRYGRVIITVFEKSGEEISERNDEM